MSCRDFEVLISLRAADALDAKEAVRVEGHLARCEECRAAADHTAAALSLARLPPVSDAERRAYRDLPVRTLAALRIAGDRRSLWKEVAVVSAVAAAALFVVLAPALVRRAGEAPTAEEPSWQGPDLEAIWDDTEVLDLEGSAPVGGEEADVAALAAVEL